ncbi:MAG: hypothetical protein JNM91_08840 [Flavobacteriales bacterium]|nr:hypothetical protein [Flavobacteriales bacterium]
MKGQILRYVLAVVLLLFGALTLFLSTSVIFDLFGVRAREGNYVLVVVWANFIASILYVLAAVGVIAQRRWPAKVLLAAVVVLVGAAVVFVWHVYSGGLYEQKTIGALAFRTLLTGAFYLGAARLGNTAHTPNQQQTR